jgi:hypothetical protein
MKKCPNCKKDIESIWEKEARRLFNSYGEELGFDENDWKVFLNRVREIVRIVLEETRNNQLTQ